MNRAVPLLALLLACSAPEVVDQPASSNGAGPEADPSPEDPAPADAGSVPMSPAQPGLLTEAEFAALHELKAEAAPPARGADVEVGGARAYLSLPAGAEGPLPAVLVIHEWWGLNGHIRHWTDRLAAAGYAALAVDLYEGTVATSPDAAMAAMKQVDQARAEAIVAAGLEFLGSDPRVQASKRGVIGWCFGGGWSLRAAMYHELDAAVMYYGRVPDPSEAARLQAPVLGVFGEQDQGIPVDSVKAFVSAAAEAGKPFDALFFDAPHAFANPSGGRYDGKSAELAWKQVQEFLRAKLKG